MPTATYRFKIGEIDCLVVKDGTSGVRPTSDLVDELPSDLIGSEIFMEGGLMVVDTPDHRLLIDAGNGPNRGPRTHCAEEAFEEEGITPESIDFVLLTHGDPDHIAGLLTKECELVYPSANYVLHTDLWRALSSDPDAGLYFASQTEFVRRLTQAVQDQCTIIETEREIVHGVRAIPATGHRAGHTIYRLQSEGEVLFHIGDAAFDPLFLERPELVISTEYRPDQARVTREAIARRAMAEDALIVGSHFKVNNVGHLVATEHPKQFRWVAKVPG